MPVIDEVLHTLSERDRELVLLRYFHENSFVEISARLGLSADAARFRVERALGKMRASLARKGIESTSAALAVALADQAQAAAPAGAAAAIAGAALAAPAPAASILILTRILMSTTKLKVGVLAAVVAATVGTLLIHDSRLEYQLRDQRRELQSLQAEHQRLTTQSQQQARSRTDFRPAANSEAQLSALLAQTAARSASAQSRPRPSLRAGMKAIGALNNVGLATPFTALETSIWADYTGNMDAVAKIITFLPDAQEAAKKLWASLPADAQTRFPTPESMMAAFIAESFPSDFAGYQATGDRQNGPSPDYWLVQFQYQQDDGTVVDRAIALHQIDGNWKVLVGTNGIQRLAKILSTGGGAATPQ